MRCILENLKFKRQKTPNIGELVEPPEYSYLVDEDVNGANTLGKDLAMWQFFYETKETPTL